MDKGIILIALPRERISAGILERLQRAGAGREIRISSNKNEVEQILDTIEIAVGDVPFSLVSRMTRLKWIQLWSAGADQLQRYPELKDAPFILTSTSGIHGQQISEHLFGMLFAWNRRFPAAFAAQSRHEWLKIPGGQLFASAGKTMLILGYGAAGQTVARGALAFNMKVIGLRRRPSLSAGAGVRIEAAGKLNELLPLADMVVNILPLTQDTFHLFGKTQFSLMKQTALYANMGRGAVTDEQALIEALRSKTIAGALLDVTEKEPLPPDAPLWELDNVILTGHYAGLHPGYDALAFDVTFDNLDRYVRGDTLTHRIDKTAGC
ncbi:MAG: D-2-hydroxyacid dehydrogenase [Treponema sp.]|jgi:phosphoglycerate dehydrogenase-like enzyme|nr:D-2-hydroxyacid dehydrogenase [Treponema sp.]